MQPQSDQSISPPSVQAAGTTPFSARMQESVDLKKEGNLAFKEEKYDAAKNYYQKALGLLEPQMFRGASQAECLKMAEISSNLLFNIGMCFYNRQKWKEAALFFNQAIEINPQYARAIYRKAMTHHFRKEHDEAMKQIKQAFNLDKSNQQVHQAYQKIIEEYNAQQREAREKSKQISQRIFNPAKAQEEEKAKQGSSNSWLSWAAIAPIALVGLYTGLKYLKK